MVITSTSNEQIKKLIQLKEKSKVRKTTGTFTVEGKKMFVEIPAEDLVSVYVSETFLELAESWGTEWNRVESNDNND